MNVILYVIDSLRTDHVHAFGYHRDTTPTIDRLASHGAMFRQCFANAGWTAPSGASILSGQYPTQTGIHKTRDPLNRNMPWLPELLQRQGIATAAFSTIFQVSKLRGFDRGFDVFCDLFLDRATIDRCQARGQDARGDDYCLPLSEDMHVEALQWIDGHRSKNPDNPFFSLLWSIDTHEPFRHPAEYNVDVDPTYSGFIDGTGRPFSWIRNRADLRQVIDIYDGSLRYQDAKLGEFIRSLQDRDLWDETLLIVCGDHGEMFFEHGVAGHGKFPWKECMHVPLIMHCPKALPSAKIDARVQLIDIAPSVLDALDLPAEPGLRGKSVLPLARGQIARLHDKLLLETPYPFDRRELARVVMADDWKYIEYTPASPRQRFRKITKEIGRALTVFVRPGFAPILYSHHWRRGLRGMAKLLLMDGSAYLLGRPVRRLFNIAVDQTESRDHSLAQPKIVQAMAEQHSMTTRQPSSSCESLDSDTERKVTQHLRDLGYVE